MRRKKLASKSDVREAESSRNIGIHRVYHRPNNDANHNVHVRDNRHLSDVSEKMRPGRTTRAVLWGSQEDKTVFFFCPFPVKKSVLSSEWSQWGICPYLLLTTIDKLLVFAYFTIICI